MSDDNKSTTGTFTAETEKGERPLFAAEEVFLSERFQAPDTYWQGLGKQIIPSGFPPDNKFVWLGVYVPENATAGDHDFIEEPAYRASYASGTNADLKSYQSTTGKIHLEIVPTVEDPRMKGSIEFTAKHATDGTTVEVTSGEFNFSGLSPYKSAPFDKP